VRKKLGLFATEEYGMKISMKNVVERISVCDRKMEHIVRNFIVFIFRELL
jgi:hypothetical protein